MRSPRSLDGHYIVLDTLDEKYKEASKDEL